RAAAAVAFPRVVAAGQDIERRLRVVYRVQAQAAAVDRADIQVLQLVVREISTYKSENVLRQIPVEPRSRQNRVSRYPAAGPPIVRVKRRKIKCDVIRQRLAVRKECGIQVCCLAIPARKRQTNVHASLPRLEQARVSAVFVSRLILDGSHDRNLRKRYSDIAARARMYHNFRV